MLQDKERIKSIIDDISNKEYVFIRITDRIKDRIEVKHSICNHIWELSYQSFINGSRCPKCKQELKHREFVEKVKSTYGEDYTVLSEFYQNNSYVKLRHEKCGLFIYRKPKELFEGKVCKSCNGRLGIVNKLEKRICNYCNSEFYVSESQKNSSSMDINWCSIECKELMKENKCKRCGVTFMSKYKSAYCSDKCRTQICSVCGKIYIGNYGQNFCSKECREKFYTKVCKICGKKFITRNKKEVCSRECTKAYKSVKKYHKICKFCTKPFIGLRNDIECCSEVCLVEYNKIRPKVVNKENYNKQLEDIKSVVSYRVKLLIDKKIEAVRNLEPTIDYRLISGFNEALKAKVRNRDNNRCFICESVNDLEVHHIVPKRLGGGHIEKNLITLCLKCHRYIETTNYEYAVKKCIVNAKKTLGIVEISSKLLEKIVPKYELDNIKNDLSDLFRKLENVDFDEILEFKQKIADIIDDIERCIDELN